jgi:hypothetical protein
VTFGGQLRQKADEVRLQEKAKDFGDAVAEVVTTAVGLVAGYAKENRSRLDEALDSAERFVNDRTDGKHAETVLKVRSSVVKGVDSLMEHGDERPRTAGRDTVPDDVHSAFGDEAPEDRTPGDEPGTPSTAS